MWRKLTVFGMISSIVYVLHVVIGGILWKGYSHFNNAISDLTGAGAHDKALLLVFTTIYAVCAIIFSLSAYIYLKNSASRTVRVGILIYLAMHIVSASYGFFPVDPIGAPITFLGAMHIVVTALIVPLTIAAPIVIGAGIKKAEGYKTIGIYSIWTGCFMFVAGGLSVILAANTLPMFGLVERLNIGSLQVWMFIFSFMLFRKGFPRKQVAYDKSDSV